VRLYRAGAAGSFRLHAGPDATDRIRHLQKDALSFIGSGKAIFYLSFSTTSLKGSVILRPLEPML